jgi:hypothetical protein
VFGYPAGLLHALANELVANIDTADNRRLAVLNGSEEPAVSLADAATEPSPANSDDLKTRPMRPQPPTSRTIVDRYEDGGITLNVPSPGLLKGSRGLFLFGIFWTVISIIIGSVILVGMLGDGQFGGLLFAAPLLLIFLAIGVAMLVAGVNMGTRRIAVAVFDGQLSLMQKSALGARKLEWDCHEIAGISVGPSGMTVNDVPVLELQIQTEDGKTGLLAGHDDDELRWLADEMYRAVVAQRPR